MMIQSPCSLMTQSLSVYPRTFCSLCDFVFKVSKGLKIQRSKIAKSQNYSKFYLSLSLGLMYVTSCATLNQCHYHLKFWQILRIATLNFQSATKRTEVRQPMVQCAVWPLPKLTQIWSVWQNRSPRTMDQCAVCPNLT